MDCPFCDHHTSHKHGKTSKGSQRYRCAACRQTFTETFDTLYYRRQVTPEQVELILQAHAEGSSLRGISRIGKRAYGTVVDIVRKASYKAAQLVHNEEVKEVECAQITADEMWSFVKKSAPPALRSPQRKAGASSRNDVNPTTQPLVIVGWELVLKTTVG